MKPRAHTPLGLAALDVVFYHAAPNGFVTSPGGQRHRTTLNAYIQTTRAIPLPTLTVAATLWLAKADATYAGLAARRAFALAEAQKRRGGLFGGMQ
jgi:hypothetical protein